MSETTYERHERLLEMAGVIYPQPRAEKPEVCCVCGKGGLSTIEGDGGGECQLTDGRWVCSAECWEHVVGFPDRKPDPVNSPSHYNTGGIECFDAMSAMLTREEMIGYLRGNSFKYRWRFRHKGGAEDLRKAEWYEKKLLDLIENSA